MAAVVPVAMMIGSYIASRRAQKKAMEKSKEEQAALAGAQQGAQNLQQTGQELTQTGAPAQRQALGYYQTLLRGSRPAMQQAVAQPTAAITDIYRGAERSLEKGGVQGAQRDVAMGEIARQRASQIAGLTTGVQPMAAQAIAGLGGQMTEQGLRGSAAGGGLYSDLLNQGLRARMYGREQGQQAGQQWGSIAGNLAGMAAGYFGGGGGWGGGGGGSQPQSQYDFWQSGQTGPVQGPQTSGWRNWFRPQNVPPGGDLSHNPPGWPYVMS